jgi:hypothetical protein
MASSAQPEFPSAKGVLVRLLAAGTIGAVIVVCAVLPAEYHVDPTGFGRISGLLAMSAPAKPEENKAPTAETSAVEPVLPKNAWFFPAEFRTDTIKIPLKADGELEWKVLMKTGGVLVYSWSTDQGKVYYDFHGEPLNNPKGSKSYREDQEGASTSSGGLVAPFEGIHGWYFLNLTDKPQVVTVKLAGFYQLREKQ